MRNTRKYTSILYPAFLSDFNQFWRSSKDCNTRQCTITSREICTAIPLFFFITYRHTDRQIEGETDGLFKMLRRVANASKVSKQQRQCWYNATLRRVRVTVVAVEKNYISWMCVYTLSYPKCKGHALYYTVICCLFGCTIVFHIIS